MKKNRTEDLTISITITAAILLGYLMAISLVASHAWDSSDINEVPMGEVARTLFNEYAFALIVLGLLLSASVVGGIFLAKMEVRD